MDSSTKLIMNSSTSSLDHTHSSPSYQTLLRTNRLGMWLFFIS